MYTIYRILHELLFDIYGLLPEYLVPKHRITLSEYAGMIVSRERRSLERDAEIPAYSREVIRCFGTRYSGNDPFIIYCLILFKKPKMQF